MSKILYVEDEQLNITLVEKMLKHMPYTLEVAREGRSALDIALRVHPDLVLLDIHLPDYSGLDVARDFKAHPVLRRIPLVAFTADLSNQLACLEAGCDGYLTKPVNRSLLMRTIYQFLPA